MVLKTPKTRLKKFFKYLSLGGFTTLLTIVLALGGFPGIVGMTGVKAAVPASPAVHSSTFNVSQLVQDGLQSYQSGQFVAAVKIWQQAADAFAAQGDRLNQAMVLSNLALAYHQLGQWSKANRAIATSLQLLQTEDGTSDRLKILAQALNTEGKLQLAQGRTEQALATWQKATKT
jgi:tetratricopeptide (TPR) repeat protein